MNARARSARLVFDAEVVPRRPTVIVLQGAWLDAIYSPLTMRLGGVNVGRFHYDAEDRLAAGAAALRSALARLPQPVCIVAHGTACLLPLYLGATDVVGALPTLAAVYLDPTIGGSRYASDHPVLWPLRPLKTLVFRNFCAPCVQDLAPESDFQQAIFGRRSRPSSFRDHSLVVCATESERDAGIPPVQVPWFFGRSWPHVLDRIGDVVRRPLEPTGETLDWLAMVMLGLLGSARQARPQGFGASAPGSI